MAQYNRVNFIFYLIPHHIVSIQHKVKKTNVSLVADNSSIDTQRQRNKSGTSNSTSDVETDHPHRVV